VYTFGELTSRNLADYNFKTSEFTQKNANSTECHDDKCADVWQVLINNVILCLCMNCASINVKRVWKAIYRN